MFAKHELVDREKAHAAETYPDDHASSNAISGSDAQAGVKRIEAVSTAWTKWSLICAYAG